MSIEYKLICPKTKEFVSVELKEDFCLLALIPAYTKLYNRALEKGMSAPFVLSVSKDGKLDGEYFNTQKPEELEIKEGIYESNSNL